MTYNENYIEPVLADSQYDVGMQNKKMERQAIKGLSPKYCYATLSADTAMTHDAFPIVPFNTFETNDNRMNKTSWRIIVPQKWIWLVTGSVWIDTTNDVNMLLLSNGLLYLSWTFVAQAFGKKVINFTVPVLLNQNDYIEMQVNYTDSTNKNALKTYTTLRLISYILY